MTEDQKAHWFDGRSQLSKGMFALCVTIHVVQIILKLFAGIRACQWLLDRDSYLGRQYIFRATLISLGVAFVDLIWWGLYFLYALR